MLSVKQGGIKYHLLSPWYNSTRDWTPVSRTIGEQYDLLNHNFEEILFYFIKEIRFPFDR